MKKWLFDKMLNQPSGWKKIDVLVLRL